MWSTASFFLLKEVIRISIEYMKLGDFCEIITGIPEEKKIEDASKEYWCVQPSSLNEFNEILNISKVFRKNEISEKALLKHNDIIIKRIGPSHINIVENPKDNTYVTSNLMIIRIVGESDANYIATILESKGLSLLTHYTNKGVTVQTVSKKELSQIEIPFIEKDKQKIIGDLWSANKRKLKLLSGLMIQEKEVVKSVLSKIIELEEKK